MKDSKLFEHLTPEQVETYKLKKFLNTNRFLAIYSLSIFLTMNTLVLTIKEKLYLSSLGMVICTLFLFSVGFVLITKKKLLILNRKGLYFISFLVMANSLFLLMKFSELSVK
ncbi:MAG: hypothetical protein GY909_02615 [Oligoflexia bacterium]|nr:hypothetical protein [Oligoflexia bacterium]